MAAPMQESSVSIGSDAVRVCWTDGTVSRLPFLWLRDNCGCDECRVAQTSEKRFMVADVAVDLRPADVTLLGNSLQIAWPDGHLTRYLGSEIRALETQQTDPWTPWSSDFRPRRTEFRPFLEDDTVAAAAIENFIEYGAMVLTAAPTEAGTLEMLAPRLGPLREVLFARIHDVEVDPAGYNVAHTPMALPPHNDFASYSWPPSVQALHMLANETPGGESVIVDGWRIVGELCAEHPGHFEALCAMPVPFREFDADNETFATAPMIQLDSDGEVAAFRFSNQLMQAIPPNRPGVADFYRAYHELCRRVTAASAKAVFRLEAGQILIVASHRVLHAREAFEPTGRRHLQDAYFEYDNVRNHLVVLRRRGEP
jgi:gamma-butyrobetaine dioxygenase